MVFTNKHCFIANCNPVELQEGIDSNHYIVERKGNTIVVYSIKKLKNCSEEDVYNYINKIKQKIEKNIKIGITNGTTFMEKYINKILNKEINILLLGIAKFKITELDNTKCSIMMNIHRWTKKPKTMYESIKIVLYYLYRTYKLSLDCINVFAKLNPNNPTLFLKAFEPMGFEMKSFDTNGHIIQLNWMKYTQLYHQKVIVEYV